MFLVWACIGKKTQKDSQQLEEDERKRMKLFNWGFADNGARDWDCDYANKEQSNGIGCEYKKKRFCLFEA